MKKYFADKLIKQKKINKIKKKKINKIKKKKKKKKKKIKKKKKKKKIQILISDKIFSYCFYMCLFVFICFLQFYYNIFLPQQSQLT